MNALKKQIDDQFEKYGMQQVFQTKEEQALQRAKSGLEEFTSKKKYKNALRHQKVQQRVALLTQEQDKRIMEEIQRQHDTMSLTFIKQKELDKYRRDLLKKKELEYQMKVNQIKTQRETRDMQELMDIDNKMNNFQEKQRKSQEHHQKLLEQISQEAKYKNQVLKEKVEQCKQVKQQIEEEIKEKFDFQQLKVQKQLEQAHEQTKSRFEDFKFKNSTRFQQYFNKNVINQSKKDIEDRIQNKHEKSQSILEQFKVDKERELLLKNEERRLREQDIKKLRERQKRLYEQKRNQIVEKELTSSQFLKEVKSSQELLNRMKLEASIKGIQESQNVKKTLNEIVTERVSLTPKRKQFLEEKGVHLNYDKMYLKKKQNNKDYDEEQYEGEMMNNFYQRNYSIQD